MGHFEQEFTTRQYMKRNDFEFFHYKDDPSLEVGFHNHDFYEIYFFISGNVNFIIEGKYYHLKPSDIILINNQEIHKPILESGCVYERFVIWINPDFIKKYCTEKSDLTVCFGSTSKDKHNLLRPGEDMPARIKNVLYRLNSVCIEKGFGNDILRNAYLAELLTYLNIAYIDAYKGNIPEEPEDIVYNKKVTEVMCYINDNLSENLSLETLSKRFFTSKYHLLREFKKYTGYTPHDYALHKRLINARTLLRDGCRISDICQSCGFGDYSNFSRSFQKVYGITPKQYRKSTQAGGPVQNLGLEYCGIPERNRVLI